MVEQLLRQNPMYRDSDEKLVARVWFIECERAKKDSKNINTYEFLCMYAECKVTLSDTITRARRKAQELYPELRGKSYVKRRKHSSTIKREIQSL